MSIKKYLYWLFIRWFSFIWLASNIAKQLSTYTTPKPTTFTQQYQPTFVGAVNIIMDVCHCQMKAKKKMRKNIFNQTFARSWSLILLSYWCCGLLNNILFFPFLPRCQSMLLRDSYYVRWESKHCYAKLFNKKKNTNDFMLAINSQKDEKLYKLVQKCF